MTMTSLRMAATTAVAAVVAATLLATPSSSADEAPAAAARKNYAVPKVGACHDYGVRESGGISAPHDPASCSGRHTAITVSVKRLSGHVNWNDDYLISNKSAVPCVKAIVKALGGDELTWVRTTYRPTWFYPTQKQRERGAKWIRCDLVQYSGTRILPLPEDLHLGKGPVPDRFARCLNANLYLIACSKAHSWRATGFLRLSGANPPAEAEARRIAIHRCPAKVTSRGFRYRATGGYEWRAGVKAMVCYSQTRR